MFDFLHIFKNAGYLVWTRQSWYNTVTNNNVYNSPSLQPPHHHSDLAVDVMERISNVADAEVGVNDELESSRRLIQVEFILASTEAEQAVSAATRAQEIRSISHNHRCILYDNVNVNRGFI